MKKIFYLIIFTLISNVILGQNEKESFWNPYIDSDRVELNLEHYDNLVYKKAYRIWTEYQLVELIKTNDSVFNGYLINFVSQNNRKGIKKKILYQKIKLSEKTVQSLMDKLHNENIESLKDSEEIEGYPQGFDGKTYIFEIGVNNIRRIYSYWEPENKKYQNPDMKEIQNVRNILKAMNKEFNLWNSFKAFRDRLPKGNYSYGMVHMSKI